MKEQSAVRPMEFTGERMVPEAADGTIFWEHVHRYRFAVKYVPGKRVLDIACGEGYGTHALSLAGAESVVGVDVSADACEHARRKYGVDARVGDAQAIPLPDASVDVVVSFETIEHVPNPSAFLDECRRVLRPGGLIIISTPNGSVYSSIHNNPFHCSEMTEADFLGILRPRFDRISLFSQKPKSANWWSPRSLAASVSPWNKMRGFWRIGSLLCPYLDGQATRQARDEPAKMILTHDPPWSNLVNPFTVRPRSNWSGEQPEYLIAIGVRP